MQHCKTCNTDKEAGEFYPGSATKCKACVLLRQKELKAARAGAAATKGKTAGKKTKTTPKAKAPKKRSKPAKADRPADSLFHRPPGMGFKVQLEVDENTGITDIRIDQFNATTNGDQSIWLNQLEARELPLWLDEHMARGKSE